MKHEVLIHLCPSCELYAGHNTQASPTYTMGPTTPSAHSAGLRTTMPAEDAFRISPKKGPYQSQSTSRFWKVCLKSRNMNLSHRISQSTYNCWTLITEARLTTRHIARKNARYSSSMQEIGSHIYWVFQKVLYTDLGLYLTSVR